MNIFNIFKGKNHRMEKAIEETKISPEVHEDKNKFTIKMLQINREVKKINEAIKKAKEGSQELQRALTATERLWLATGRRKYE